MLWVTTVAPSRSACAAIERIVEPDALAAVLQIRAQSAVELRVNQRKGLHSQHRQKTVQPLPMARNPALGRTNLQLGQDDGCDPQVREFGRHLRHQTPHRAVADSGKTRSYRAGKALSDEKSRGMSDPVGGNVGKSGHDPASLMKRCRRSSRSSCSGVTSTPDLVWRRRTALPGKRTPLADGWPASRRW